MQTGMKLWLLVFVVQWWCSSAYHVLVVFPIPSRSHNTLGKGIVDALLQAGHERFINAVPRLNIIDISITTQIADDFDFADPRTSGLWFMRWFSRNISQTALDTPALRDAVLNSQFDAVVTEPFFSFVDGGYAAVLQVPWIAFMSVSIQPYLEQQVDEVRSVSTVPMLYNFDNMPMGFIGRVVNSVIHAIMTLDGWIDYPTLISFYKTLFGPLAAARGVTLPPWSASYYNVSLLLVNSHPSISPAKSLPPNVVEIGGFHIKESTPPLPKDLQDLLDGSPQGVVYFSMGSVLQSANFPEVTKRELLKVFGELPYTVLWKFEEQLDGRPKNVHIRPWMPQDSILAHPNVKLFITHGGLLSMLEAVQHAVPLLSVPVYGDQGTNAVAATQLGIGTSLHYDENMAARLKTQLEEMMRNDRYSKRVKHVSKLFRNRPVKPSKLIAHYIELVIETQGAYHLRSSSQLYWWYQRWMLDQLAVLLLLLTLLFLTCRRVLHLLRSITIRFTVELNKKND